MRACVCAQARALVRSCASACARAHAQRALQEQSAQRARCALGGGPLNVPPRSGGRWRPTAAGSASCHGAGRYCGKGQAQRAPQPAGLADDPLLKRVPVL